MFRLAIDLVTRPILPASDKNGLNSKIRRDLGLRLPWLFANGLLPTDLEELSSCVREHGIEPHVTVFDKSARKDGTFSRDDFTHDHVGDVYRCPNGKMPTTTGALVNDGATMLYLASKPDCDGCVLKPRCCPNAPARKVPRSIYFDLLSNVFNGIGHLPTTGNHPHPALGN